jgi:hypothetical protein
MEMSVKEMNESKQRLVQMESQEAKLREQLRKDREEVRNAFRIPAEILNLLETSAGTALRNCRK